MVRHRRRVCLAWLVLALAAAGCGSGASGTGRVVPEDPGTALDAIGGAEAGGELEDDVAIREDAPEDAEPDVVPSDLPPADVLADAADAPADDADDADAPDDADAADAPAADAPADDADAADAPAPAADPAATGPFPVTGGTFEVARGDRKIPVVTHVPTRPDGAASPLVVFGPGFQLDSTDYSATLDRLASHGFVVVGATPSASLFSTDHVAMQQDMSAVLDWALSAAGPLAGRIDASRIGGMGHSLGGKVAVMTAFADPRVQAVFAIDPVNGGSPITGYSETLPDVVPDQVAPLGIPLGFAGETTDATAPFLGQACAPKDQNFETFYDAATASPWVARWEFTGANHMSFLDDPNCGLACSVCRKAPGNPAEVVAGLRTLAVAFFRKHLRSETDLDDWLTGAKVPAGVVATHKP